MAPWFLPLEGQYICVLLHRRPISGFLLFPIDCLHLLEEKQNYETHPKTWQERGAKLEFQVLLPKVKSCLIAQVEKWSPEKVR
jgi:hypothetical protein